MDCAEMILRGKRLFIKFEVRRFVVVIVGGLLCFPLASAAQQSAAPSNPAPSDETLAKPRANQDSDKDDKDRDDKKNSNDAQAASKGNASGTSKDRLFYALPNFLTLEGSGKVPPLTSREKFKVVFRGSFDYIQIPWYGFLSGISQAENSEPGFGQGAEGYGKRFGSAFADGTIENFMVGAIFPSALHQDPRFFQLGHGGFVHRASYAISRSFVTRTDSGHPQFNFSEIVGGMTSAAFSTNTYHPKSFTTVHYSATGTPTYVFTPSDRTLGNTAKVWGTQLGYDTLTLVVKEFWPDIHRKLSHKHASGDVTH
jgi:hypothetical protein